MDYEKMYKDALSHAEQAYGTGAYDDSTLEAIFPELAESEDERIINAIISFLRVTSFYSCNGCKKTEMIAWLEKQKEQESESCEPDTNVEKVIEDVIRVYGKTQGEWVGGYDVDTLIVNLRRAFNKKEQHPSSRFLPGDWVVYDGTLGHAILQVKDVVGGRYTFVDNDSTLLVEDSDKFLRHLTPKDVEKPAELSVGNYDIIPNISNQVYKAIRRTLASLAVYDEDEELLESREATLCYYSQQCAEAILKFLRPSWKPSKEQMKALLNAEGFLRAGLQHDSAKTIAELYEHLKQYQHG